MTEKAADQDEPALFPLEEVLPAPIELVRFPDPNQPNPQFAPVSFQFGRFRGMVTMDVPNEPLDKVAAGIDESDDLTVIFEHFGHNAHYAVPLNRFIVEDELVISDDKIREVVARGATRFSDYVRYGVGLDEEDEHGGILVIDEEMYTLAELTRRYSPDGFYEFETLVKEVIAGVEDGTVRYAHAAQVIGGLAVELHRRYR